MHRPYVSFCWNLPILGGSVCARYLVWIYVGNVCSRTRVTEPGVWCLMDCSTGTAPLGRTRVTEPKILDCSTGARIREELAEGWRRVDRSGVGNMCSVRYAVGAVWCLGLRAFCDHVFKHKTKFMIPSPAPRPLDVFVLAVKAHPAFHCCKRPGHNTRWLSHSRGFANFLPVCLVRKRDRKLNAQSGNAASPRSLTTVERKAERAFHLACCPRCVSGRGSQLEPHRPQAFLRVGQARIVHRI